MTAKGFIDPTRDEVRAMNRAIASMRGRMSRIPRVDASPECVAVADVVRALDEMEAQNQRVREAISE